MTASAAMVLDHLPDALRPTVQPIDTWFRYRRLGLLFEARVARGRLMVCGIDLRGDLERRHAARQMRRSRLACMGSAAFNPEVAVSPDEVARLFPTQWAG